MRDETIGAEGLGTGTAYILPPTVYTVAPTTVYAEPEPVAYRPGMTQAEFAAAERQSQINAVLALNETAILSAINLLSGLAHKTFETVYKKSISESAILRLLSPETIARIDTTVSKVIREIAASAVAEHLDKSERGIDLVSFFASANWNGILGSADFNPLWDEYAAYSESL